jgi:hypothetical protein
MSEPPAQTQTQTVLESPFQVQSVLPVPAPQGTAGDWYRYVITQGGKSDNAITGTRSGNLSEIHLQLAEMVERLNERLGKIEAKKKTR